MTLNNEVKILDCTLRDGGYYNNWNFSPALINEYIKAVHAAGVNIVELGLRSLKNNGFKGACAFTTDDFIRTLEIPDGVTVGVMINASELIGNDFSLEVALDKFFPEPASTSPVKLVRVACHTHEFAESLPASSWLKERGFIVGFNLMQVADRTAEEIESLSKEAQKWPLDVLYFADSMGSMTPDHTAKIIALLRKHWQGPLGIHTHDNMGLALQNTMRAMTESVTWLDATVTGMGRGPGNAKTEHLALELSQLTDSTPNLVPLMTIIRQFFNPNQQKFGWGTNTYYYFAGKYGIHPTYIQEMLGDSRYSEEDIFAVIERLRMKGGKNFSLNTLDSARHFYQGPPRGIWSPSERLAGREVLLLGTGPGVATHKSALESYIYKNKPFVIALNTQSQISAELIDARVACHPVRLLADREAHALLPQPLITPASMLPDDLRHAFKSKELLDFGLEVVTDTFEFNEKYAVLPSSLVMAYALAITSSGKAKNVLLAGFDGYAAGDPRNQETNNIFKTFMKSKDSAKITAITPTCYDIPSQSIYGRLEG